MVNDSTREYSVYVSDMENKIQGSGVLFYAGGDSVFVFTCAHVVDSLDEVKVFILKAIDAKKDLYKVYNTVVPASQIVFSPSDIITEDGGEKTHTEDYAIIQISKPVDVEIVKTEYFITETTRNHSVYVQGYPNGVPEGKRQIEYLDCLHGQVVVNPSDSNQFTIRMNDPAIDSGSRVYELKGLSGAPVWDDNEEENGLLGLFTSSYDTTALLSKVHATKAQILRTIMKERFNILIERKLEGIPKDDIAGCDFASTIFNGTIKQLAKTDNEKWIDNELTELRLIIDDLKLQKAINKGRELIANPKYLTLTKEYQRKVKQFLLYCYEITDMDAEFEALESDMRDCGLIKNHETLRLFTRTFLKRKFQETVNEAQHCIENWDGSERVGLLSFAKAFLLLAKAYTENLPVEETIGKLLDTNENFIFPTNETEDESLIYQMIGYVYGEHYHDYVNSVRFLNRAYRIGFDSVVLEALAAAYYNLGVFDATDDSGRVPDLRKIDRKALYKARECYLVIKGKADDLFWSGTMRRMGLCVYNTFVFLNDNYRILTLYHDILRYVPNLTDVEWRDVEMKYARISAQKGEINTNEFKHITTEDRILLEAQAKACNCLNLIEDVTASVPRNQIRNMTPLSKEIRETTRYLEDAVRKIEKYGRASIYVQMINLYGRGMLLFGWDKKEKMNSLYERLSGYADEDLLESMSNFIYEMNSPVEDSIKRFQATFEKKKTIITWQELNHLYIRHGMFDKADSMYKELLSERKELIEDGPEYAYRAFIDYVMLYRRDLKYALQCYLDAKEAFQDTDIEGFWELELMLYSNSFNNPERFEIERKKFVDKGLVSEESYHRVAFIAHLTNLDEVKVSEQNQFIRQYPHYLNPRTGMIVLSKEEIHFLNWIGVATPGFLPPRDSMLDARATELQRQYTQETWHRPIDKQLKNQFRLNKSIAIDAWSLYQLAAKEAIGTINDFDCVYVSHMSIIRLFEELSSTNNVKIRNILNYLKSCPKVKIYSAGFKAQIEVRNIAQYTEPASTIAVALEKNCQAVYGDPSVDINLVEHFGNRIIRSNDLARLIEE